MKMVSMPTFGLKTTMVSADDPASLELGKKYGLGPGQFYREIVEERVYRFNLEAVQYVYPLEEQPTDPAAPRVSMVVLAKGSFHAYGTPEEVADRLNAMRDQRYKTLEWQNLEREVQLDVAKDIHKKLAAAAIRDFRKDPSRGAGWPPEMQQWLHQDPLGLDVAKELADEL